jgi:hypothetical protein
MRGARDASPVWNQRGAKSALVLNGKGEALYRFSE